MSVVKQYRDWKRQHPDFPLTVNPNGQWSKKVRGKAYYFGRLEDPDGALREWLEDKDYLLAGVEPPTRHPGITVEELCGQHLECIDDKIKSGSMSLSTRREYAIAGKVLTSAGLHATAVDSLTPLHFMGVMQLLKKSGRRPRTQKNIITSIRVIFKWGAGMEMFDSPVRFGVEFRGASVTEIEAEQEKNGLSRFHEREAILKILAAAGAQMKVAILLGINCAFYPSDTRAVTYSSIHLDGPVPYHDMRRVKTKRRRMAALWPETVSAIRDYTENCRPKTDSDTVLVTRSGSPMGNRGSSWLAETFNNLADKVGHRHKGVSLGSLRHTYGTIMDLVTDTQMVDLTMGHVAGTVHGRASKSLQRRIYSQFNLNELKRLKAVADVVHDWLYEGKT